MPEDFDIQADRKAVTCVTDEETFIKALIVMFHR